jgi:hypothetical protein
LTAMMAALFMRTSIMGQVARILDAAILIEVGELRSICTKEVRMVGSRALIWSWTGVILSRVRPRRRMVSGEAEAREMAVSAPRLLTLAPVMTNVLPLTNEEKALTTSIPVDFTLKRDILNRQMWELSSNLTRID